MFRYFIAAISMLVFVSAFVFTCNTAVALTLKSKAIRAGKTISNAQVYNGFGCKGKNISPDLEWSHAPKNTKAFAVTVYDPDAPTGAGWWHWIAFNIPAHVTHLNLGAGSGQSTLPTGSIQGKTDFGMSSYGGPCPPVGDKPHRYQFRVYALKAKIPLNSSASGSMVGFYINQLKLAEAQLQARYGR